MSISVPDSVPVNDLPMLADLRRQARVLLHLAGRHGEFAEEGARLARQGCDRWLAFGSGDGWFAARAAQEYARRALGLDFTAASSLEVLGYALPQRLDQSLAAIGISMSGTADRTNQAAGALRAAGKPVLALTNGSGGDLGRIASSMVSLGVPDLAPFLTGTTKYTASLLGLQMILEGASTQPGTDWASYLSGLPALLEQSEALATRIGAEHAGRLPSGVRILACGPNLATADYGMAKFIKLLSVPIWSDEVEEFAHRSFWSCPASDLVIYLASEPAVARCASLSAEALGSMGMVTIAIDTPDAPVTHTHYRLTLPPCADACSPLLAAIPLQFLAYFLARAFGGRPDESQDVNDPARFRAAQLLARRSELA